MIGLTSACGQQNFENADVDAFAKLANETNVILLDVRTEAEFKEGHLKGAINIDQGQSTFINNVKEAISQDKTIAIYCRSGRRSANAASRLGDLGYKCVNLKGGIIAWGKASKPIVK